MRVLVRGTAHGHSRINLQFSRLRASLEGQAMVPKVDANVEEKMRAHAARETGDDVPAAAFARTDQLAAD